MSEAKKKDAKLDQNSMDDVKGGIPYEDPGIIDLGEPGEPGEPGVTAPIGGCCEDGYSNNIVLGCKVGYGVIQD